MGREMASLFGMASAAVSAALLMFFACFGAHAQTTELAVYDPGIPTLKDVVGHASGEAITSPDEILAYFEALAAAAPDRIRIENYAESWEGRPLFYAVISAPGTLGRLDAVKTDMARLGSGAQLSDAVRNELVERTPAIVWIAGGVHGDEISPPDSAIALAYHLLAANDDPLATQILDKTIIIIDPLQNPDGRERFIQSFRSALGLEPQADRFSAEHDQPWPGGRVNHYLFDMNRDWFANTQPETRGKVAAIIGWHPLVFVDSHEMGGDESYFFPPAADPHNPLITADQRQSQDKFGRNRGAWFDRFGISYFTREVYDAFYPGYGDMWPTLNGAIAQTFEQGSARGLKFTKRNGDELTFSQSVSNNFIAMLATLETTAAEGKRLLADYASYRRQAVLEGEQSRERFYVFDLSKRRWQAEAVARNLAAQNIIVRRLPAGSEACGRTFAAGALVIDKAQPTGRLIRALLEANTPLPADFIAEQEFRRERGQPHELYDVTAWSLPIMNGIASYSCRNVPLSGAETVTTTTPIPAFGQPADGFGYAIPWSDAGQARLTLAALASGLKAKATEKAFVSSERSFPAGTAVFPAAGNPADLGERLMKLSQGIGAEFVPLKNSWVESGPNFGSGSFASITLPRIALAWDEGTSATSAGAARFVIERNLGVPVSPIRVRTLGSADLSLYDVLIIPDTTGAFNRNLGSGGGKLKAFVEQGGVLVGFGSAIDVLSDNEVGLLDTVREARAFDEERKDETEQDAPVPGTRIADAAEYRKMIEDRKADPEDVPGVLALVLADTDHWLAAGYESAAALYSGDAIYQPLSEADGTNVFRFAGAGELLKSGYLWDQNRLQLAYKPFVMAQPRGEGIVVGFTQSPVTRAYLGDLELLIANAILFGPSRAKDGSAR